MTIASAFNEITVAQGGTASTTGSIAGAIDALNDALAGSDQEAASTIEQAVRLLGQHIGGGSSVTVEALTATENKTYTAPSGKAYSPVTVNVSGGATLGGLAEIAQLRETPTVGMDAENNFADFIIFGVLDGDAVVTYSDDHLTAAAIGATVFFNNHDEATLDDWSAYGCIGGYDQSLGTIYTSVRAIDLNGEIKTITIEGDEYECVVFQVPTLDVDSYEILGIVYTNK